MRSVIVAKILLASSFVRALFASTGRKGASTKRRFLGVVFFALVGFSTWAGVSEFDQVISGEVVELDKDSEVILGAPDQSAFQLNSYAKLQPILEKEGGQINLERGSVTVAITQKRNRKYQLRMPALQVGVRGTVFHAEANWFGEPDQSYFCLCYGQADLQGDNGEELLPLSARYHTAVVGRADEENTVIQPLDSVANHDDPGIKRIIELGKVPHEMSWLRL